MSDAQVGRIAKGMVILITAAALTSSIYSTTSLVALLLIGYAGVAQFFPGVVLGLYWDRVTRTGVFAGLTTGTTIAAILMLTKRDPFRGVNAGFIAFCFNFAVTTAVSLFTSTRVSGFDVEPSSAPAQD